MASCPDTTPFRVSIRKRYTRGRKRNTPWLGAQTPPTREPTDARICQIQHPFAPASGVGARLGTHPTIIKRPQNWTVTRWSQVDKVDMYNTLTAENNTLRDASSLKNKLARQHQETRHGHVLETRRSRQERTHCRQDTTRLRSSVRSRQAVVRKHHTPSGDTTLCEKTTQMRARDREQDTVTSSKPRDCGSRQLTPS